MCLVAGDGILFAFVSTADARFRECSNQREGLANGRRKPAGNFARPDGQFRDESVTRSLAMVILKTRTLRAKR